jgi:mono/diheme cytochrome c family protein
LDDVTASLEARVRAYLEVNCAQCHQPGAPAPSSFDVRAATPLALTGLIGGLPNHSGGDPLNRLVTRGNLERSILFQRISGTSAGTRMPPIATRELDLGAVELLAAWILVDLPNRFDYAEWRAVVFGDSTGPETEMQADADGDGVSNYLEYLTGTDPLDASDVWTLSLAAADGAIEVSFERPPNLGVVIESSVDLVTWRPWNVLGNQPRLSASSEPVSLSAAGGADEKRFFRARFTEP